MTDDTRDFSWYPGSRTRALIERHLGRIGAAKTTMTDPLANLQLNILRLHLDLLAAALDDEHLEPDVARRILERVIYGAAPNPVDVEARNEQLQRAVIDVAAPIVITRGRLGPDQPSEPMRARKVYP